MLRRTTGWVLAAAAVLCAPAGPAATAAPAKGDPLLPRQWGLALVEAQRAWKVATGKGVVVAVVDGGVDATNPDLRGKVLPGKDFVHGSRNAWSDVDGHGTNVAGIIAATRDNGLGVAGVAPDARILPVKSGEVLPDPALTPAAVRWAADQGAKVILISEATMPGFDVVYPVLLDGDVQAAIDHAWAKGAVVVVAAGNNSEPICSSPASLRHVVCVGAVDKRGVKPTFSSFDATMTHDYLVAPGGSDAPYAGFDNPAGDTGEDEQVWTTAVAGIGTSEPQGRWAQVRGTSFASPFVAGVAALLVQKGLTNAQVVRRLEATATDLGPPGRDPVFGFGLVNAARAVGAVG